MWQSVYVYVLSFSTRYPPKQLCRYCVNLIEVHSTDNVIGRKTWYRTLMLLFFFTVHHAIEKQSYGRKNSIYFETVITTLVCYFAPVFSLMTHPGLLSRCVDERRRVHILIKKIKTVLLHAEETLLFCRRRDDCNAKIDSC